MTKAKLDIQLQKELRSKFKGVTAKNGTNMTKKIIEFIEEYVENDSIYKKNA